MILIIMLDDYFICWKCFKIVKIHRKIYKEDYFTIYEDKAICPKCGKILYENKTYLL